jgi:osmotically inducible lipoprotein OsmB
MALRISFHFTSKVAIMKNYFNRVIHIAAIGGLLTLTACAGMSSQEKSTAIGAGVGAVGGSILGGGSAIGTLGGAAVGGVIGHEVAK